jgi:hypothetical protein
MLAPPSLLRFCLLHFSVTSPWQTTRKWKQQPQLPLDYSNLPIPCVNRLMATQWIICNENTEECASATVVVLPVVTLTVNNKSNTNLQYNRQSFNLCVLYIAFTKSITTVGMSWFVEMMVCWVQHWRWRCVAALMYWTSKSNVTGHRSCGNWFLKICVARYTCIFWSWDVGGDSWVGLCIF